MDSFTAGEGTNLGSHVGEVGATWTIHPLANGSGIEIHSNKAVGMGSESTYIASGVPPSADYSVSGDVVGAEVDGGSANGVAALFGRFSATQNSGYFVQKYQGNVSLYRSDPGTNTLLGSASVAHVNGRMALVFSGSNVKVTWDGATLINVTDTGHAGPGLAGIHLGTAGGLIGGTTIDNFAAG